MAETARRLTLVGYRACGKTTVGRLVAERSGLRFVDADRVLEGQLGEPIATWFPAHGEPAFRKREADCLQEILNGTGGMVLSTGGGAVLDAGNREVLRRLGGLVVFLDAPANVLSARLKHDHGNRPSLSGLPIADEVRSLLAKRLPFYQETAHITVDATQDIEAIVLAITQLMKQRGA